MHNIEKYFKKHDIKAEEILYVYRENKKTIICTENGAENTSLIPVHEIMDYLPQDKFLSISKGILVHRDRIVHISDTGVYNMTDGKSFQGRQRYLSIHKKIRRELGLDSAHVARKLFQPPQSFFEKCSLLDDMPLAYCIIELVFDENGHGVDFIFRYCNKQMEVIEGIPLNQMLNHSFYEVFKNGDRKWLITYADVALTGRQHTLTDYSPEIDKHLIIHCYQPESGYCACILIPTENDTMK